MNPQITVAADLDTSWGYQILQWETATPVTGILSQQVYTRLVCSIPGPRSPSESHDHIKVSAQSARFLTKCSEHVFIVLAPWIKQLDLLPPGQMYRSHPTSDQGFQAPTRSYGHGNSD